MTRNASFDKLLEYEQLARADDSTTASSGNLGDWVGVGFRIGADQLVCSTERIYESTTIPNLTRVPGTRPFILGLASIHGDLVTVIDLNTFFHDQPTQITGSSRLLLAHLRGRPVGLLVDELFGHRNFMGSDAATSTLPEHNPLQPVVRKMHRSGTEIWHELDLPMLFSRPDFLNGAAN